MALWLERRREMIKKHLKTLIITSLMILVPLVVGLVLWNELPEQMPIHWNASGEVDDWGSKPFVVFGLPLLMLAAQWLCVLGTGADPKQARHPEKVLQLILWIIPLINLVLFTVTFLVALGMSVQINVVMPLLVGTMIIVIGNYMPKCKQNYTIGIKLPWTLNSEENWNRTHRLAGWLWVVCGLGTFVATFLGAVWLLVPLLLMMILVPVTYSYILYRKGI